MSSPSGYPRVLQGLLAGRHVPLPRHLIIEITSLCNLRCRMCPKTNGAVNTAENRVMSWEIFERLIPILPAVESLDLTGVWGEAFLHPELYLRMLKAIKAQGADVYTISNGTLLTDDLARRLVEGGLDKLTISLDASTPETYAKVRPPGRLDDVLKGLRALQAWKRRLGRVSPRLDLAFVGMRTNMDEFPDAVRLAADLGAWQICLQAMGEYPGLENESVAAHHKEMGRRALAEARAVARENGVRIVMQPEDQFEEDRRACNAVGDERGLRKDCRDLWDKALVSTTGDVLPCCSSPVSMGNLGKADFAAIWRGPAYNALRRQFLGGTVPAMCRHCTGTAWVPQSAAGDLAFFTAGLMLPRVKRRTKRALKRVTALRWIKRQADRIRGRSIAVARG